MGFGLFNTTRRTINGYEIMNMLRRGQVEGVEGAVKERVEFIYQIFGISAYFQRNSLTLISFFNPIWSPGVPHCLSAELNSTVLTLR